MQIHPSAAQARQLLFTHPVTGERYYLGAGHHLYQVTATGGVSTRYTDADERPGDHTHDGDGWSERVREYTTADQPTPDDVRDLLLGLANTDPAVWPAPGPAERGSYFAAVTAWWGSLQPDGRLARQLRRDGRGGWCGASTNAKAPTRWPWRSRTSSPGCA